MLTFRARALAWLLLLCWVEVFAQAHGLRVQAVDHELASVEPRHVVTLAFSVGNDSERAQELEPRLQLPPGWRAVTPDLPFTLAPGETTVRFVSFVVPDGAPAADHAVRYLVRNRLQPELFAEHTVSIRVKAMRCLEVAPLDLADAVISGQPYRAVFVVRNAGNAAVTVDFRARSSLGHPVAPAEGRLELAPRESRELALDVRTEALPRLGFDQISLNVGDGTELSAQASRAVKLLPVGGGGESLYRTIAGQARLIYLAQDRDGEIKTGWQTELSGAGAIDEAGERHVAFLLRGPDARHAATFGRWDEYRFEYTSKGLAVGVGDLAYGLSPLTEYGRYGRGVQASYTSGAWDFGLYEMGDRFTDTGNRQLGARASRALSASSRLGLNYLAKSGERTANIYSLQAIEQRAGLSAEAELAASEGDDAGNAFRTYVYGATGDLRYSGTALYAEPGFAGYYRDQAFVSASGDYSLAQGWGMRATAFWQRTNLDRVVSRPALEESRLALGVALPDALGINLSADLFLRRKRDLRPNRDVDLVHPGFRVNGSYSRGHWGLAASGEFGATEDRVRDRRYATSLGLLSMYWRPSERQSYSLYLIRDDNTYSTIRQAVGSTAGVSAGVQLWQRARLNLNVQRSVAENANRFVTLGFEQTLRGGQIVSLFVRSTSGKFSRQTDAELSLTLPFGIPVARRPDLAPLRGRLLDAETGAGLAGVTLSLDGAIVMTDADGFFRYDAAKIGRRFLTLAGTGAAGKVPLRPLPLETEIRADGDNYVELRFVQPGMMKGRVQRYESAAEMPSQAYRDNGDDALTGGVGVAGALVTLTSGELKYRRLTDADGRFRIDGLPPGRWLVSVDERTLPPGGRYQAEQLQFVQDVRSGAETLVDFKLRPKTRRLKMLPLSSHAVPPTSTAATGIGVNRAAAERT
ncbi:NEW3 domain-containing protein [Aromatoleum aromaticum]|uniref:NEW3 domain-containing protein n=1 Tax=Aromatoleum aromaticum TaxID=551760 RepID=UPI0002DB2B80|nr:NEW3 domain-containing protein [Aromatoleum aromaticum]